MSTLPLVVLQMGGGGQMGNGMGPGGWGFGYGFVGLAVMLLVLGTIAYVVVQAFSGGGATGTGSQTTSTDHGRPNHRGPTTDDDSALLELRQRYASGEIDDEEFEERARRLREDSDT